MINEMEIGEGRQIPFLPLIEKRTFGFEFLAAFDLRGKKLGNEKLKLLNKEFKFLYQYMVHDLFISM